ncbi:MFS transporter [Soehngenia saccharolytica]|nr:MFS transporter [Soehngenia saccharolytica]
MSFKKLMIFAGFMWALMNFHHPVNPAFFEELDLPSHVFGTSYAMMVFFSFLSSPFWGAIGDKYSRKKTLVVSTFFYGLAQFLYGFSNNLWQILALRAMAGWFTGGMVVGLMAMIVEIDSSDNLSKNMATYSAVLSIFTSIGFLIGGLLGYLPIRYVFYIQGLGMILVSISFMIFTEDIPKKSLLDGANVSYKLVDTKKIKSIKSPWTIIFLIVTFLIFLAFSSTNNAFNYYLRDELKFMPIINGVFKALTGILGLVSNLTINVYLIKHFDLKKALRYSIFISTVISMLIYIESNNIIFLLSSLIYFTLNTIQLPILQSFAVEKNKDNPGLLSGIFNASKSLGEMLGALVAGFIYAINNRFPFLVSIFALGLSYIILAGYMAYQKRLGEI